ncbi:MAG TPA: selenocysteine synthase [Bryobacteraceae bacterium]|nr:selenocysteine synthase [Bryobacteraceae bacterium]
MADRRSFLSRAAAFPIFGAWLARRQANAAAPSVAARDYFKELGVRTFINAAGTYTALSASQMPDEVMDAIRYASKQYVSLTELQDKVGARIATLLGCEFAMVTSGAAGALAVGTAGCITGKDVKAVRQLPDVSGLKSEVIVQKAHRYGYDHSVRATGIRMVEVETSEQASAAVSPRTAMMLFWADGEPLGAIKSAEWVAIGKKHGIPTFCDAADCVPPVSRLTDYLKTGFDLVTFSGGKGIRGPQSAGLLLGRRDLIEAARLNTSPNSDTIARGMKVNKEEILGMMVALELYLKKDHAAEWKEWEKRVETVATSAREIPSVTTEVHVPPIANHVPHLKISWDQSKVKLTPPEVMRRLREGQPSIEAGPGTNTQELVIGVWMMKPGEAEIVASKVRDLLRTAAV